MALEADNAALHDEVAQCAKASDLAGLASASSVAELSAEVASLAATIPRRIDGDLTINVPADATLPEAIASLDDATIAPNATVTIAIAAGTQTLDAPLVIDHADGARIRIIGSNSTLSFASDGISVTSQLGLLDGVTLQGTDRNGVGLEVGAGRATLGAVVVDGFAIGIDASLGARIRATALVVRHNGTGLVAFGGASIAAVHAVASENAGDGFRAASGAVLQIDQGSATDNGENGLDCLGAFCSMIDGVVGTNEGDGVVASGGAVLSAAGITIDSNAGSGLSCLNAFCALPNASVEDNQRFGVNVSGGFVNFTGSVAQANGEADTNVAPTSNPTGTIFQLSL